MQFEIDKVSEDSFYANFLLGLPKVLDRLGITACHLTRKPPLTETEILQWEMRFGVRLPEDLRDFYAATDGFLYQWHINSENEQGYGKIRVNSLNELLPVHGYVTTKDPGVVLSGKHFLLNLGLESKVFELDVVEGYGKVVLVYHNVRFVPTIWLYLCAERPVVVNAAHQFHFLSDDFTTYMRMAIAHLGIDEWQMVVTPEGISETCSELFLLLAPHLLTSAGKYDAARKSNKARKTDDDFPDVPLNEIDSDFMIPKHQLAPPATNTIVDCNRQKKGDKKKVGSSSAKFRTQAKFKRKPLYYLK